MDNLLNGGKHTRIRAAEKTGYHVSCARVDKDATESREVWQLLGGTLVLVMGLPTGVGAGLCGPDLGQVWRVKLHGPLGQEGQGKVRGTPSCSLLEITRRPLRKSPL